MSELRWLLGAIVGVSACGPNVQSDGDGSASDTSGGSTDPDATDPDGPTSVTVDTGNDDGPGAILLSDQHAVDVLFVVDNSATMGDEQARLAAGIGALVERLEAGGLDYRIGVTTTDNGHPYCAATGPEAGRLVASSCRARAGEFAFAGDPPVDVTDIACFDQCAAEDLGIVPTTTALDPQPTARPWIERTGGIANVEGLTTTEALRCMLPQGIVGCGFEQHLESMYKAILRSEQEEEAQFGFVRSDAVLAVVMVSDETDCSYSNEWQSIFLPADQGGNPDVFWSDPNAPLPSSAVCWNAGVACTGGPDVYDECHAENKDVDGGVGASDDAAVLLPVSRYAELLQELEDRKREIVPNQEVVVAAITGVPPGYETDQAELVYARANDALIQDEYGIGPGCVRLADGSIGIPPVRERELAEAFEVDGQRNLYSICADDFAPALDAIGGAIRDQIHPPCFPVCVADTNPVTPALDPLCTVLRESPNANGGIDELEVLPCEGGAVPAGQEVCYEMLTGDALSPICADEGWNLEFRFVQADGVPAPPGAVYEATCQLSAQSNVDCPDL